MQKIKIRIENLGDQFAEYDFVLTEYDRNSRLKLALKKLFIYWSLALFFILIPVLHFILVPLFFILGAVIFARQMSQATIISQAQAHCPNCKQELILKNIKPKFPINDFCPHCRHGYRIHNIGLNKT